MYPTEAQILITIQLSVVTSYLNDLVTDFSIYRNAFIFRSKFIFYYLKN